MTPTPSYFSDGPAKAGTDALSRNAFASSLAHALVTANAQHGFVIGIEGPWGSGKSSIIEFAKDALTSDAMRHLHPIVVEFNPWMVSNTGALVEAMLGQIAAAVGFCASPTARSAAIAERLLKYVAMLGHLKALKYLPMTGWVGNAAEDIARLAESFSDHTKEAQESVDDVKKAVAPLDLAHTKAALHKALSELDRTIVVIIDDLDRLPADEIRTVVQAIKAIADFPHTTYLLAYDREVVARALGSNDATLGDAYLEKIVQVAYPIPPIFHSQLRSFIATNFAELRERLNTPLRPFEEADQDRALNVLTKMLRHPRDVIRLMNRLVLSLPATYTEVNMLDVMVFEALSQRFPTIREKIHRHPVDFLGHGFRGDIDPGQSADGATAQDHAWTRHLPSSDAERAIATYACEFLFASPKPVGVGDAEQRLRLVAPDRLARFLRKSSLDDVPDAASIHPLLRDAARLRARLAPMPDQQLPAELRWISLYARSCTAPDLQGCIGVFISEAGARYAAPAPLAATIQRDFANTIVALINLVDSDQRPALWMRIVKEAPLGVAGYILDDEFNTPEARQAWIARFQQARDAGLLAAEPLLGDVLDIYGGVNRAYGEVFDLIADLLKTDLGLRNFLSVYRGATTIEKLGELVLTDQPAALAARIAASPFAHEYEPLAQLLRNDYHAEQLTKAAADIRNNERAQREFDDAVQRRIPQAGEPGGPAAEAPI